MSGILDKVLFGATLTLYIAGSLSHLVYLFRSHAEAAVRVGVRLFAAGFAFHLVYTVAGALEAGHIPVLSWQEATSFFALGVMGLYLLIDRAYRIKALGAFAGAVATGFCVLSVFLSPEMKTAVRPEMQSFWFPIHVVFAFLGDGLFALAAVVGAMFLIQDYQLKHKAISPLLNRLPSLDVLDELGYRCLAFGFPLLTVGIITGSVWSMSAFGDYWSWTGKQVWSLVTWLLYAALIHGRLTAGWRGRRASIGSIAGFALVVGSFFLTSHFI